MNNYISSYSIFRGCFLPDKSIVSNDQNKPISKVCKEWLLYLNDDKLIPEVPIKIDKEKIRNKSQKDHMKRLKNLSFMKMINNGLHLDRK